MFAHIPRKFLFCLLKCPRHKRVIQQYSLNENFDDEVTVDMWIVDPYGDRGEYRGPVADVNGNQLPDGQGTMVHGDGRIYEGKWKIGHWHGQGRATFPNGDVFRGYYPYDQRHVHGAYH